MIIDEKQPREIIREKVTVSTAFMKNANKIGKKMIKFVFSNLMDFRFIKIGNE
jgi:hypothetical protein